MPDPYIIIAWLRVASLSLVLIMIVLLIVCGVIGFVLAARARQRSLDEYMVRRRPMTEEQRRRFIEDWAAEQRRRG